MPALYASTRINFRDGADLTDIIAKFRYFSARVNNCIFTAPHTDLPNQYHFSIETGNIDYDDIEHLINELLDPAGELASEAFMVHWHEQDDDYDDNDNRWFGPDCEVAEADYELNKALERWIVNLASEAGLRKAIELLKEEVERRFPSNGFTD